VENVKERGLLAERVDSKLKFTERDLMRGA
jgi:hypothetical protein